MVKKKRERSIMGTLSFTIFLFAFTLFLVSSAISAEPSKVLKIGSAMPISGPQATVGLAWARGYDIFADWINDKGGLSIGKEKYRIQMINEDSKMNPEAAASSATKLVHQDQVKFVIGEILDPCGEAIYGVASPAKALHALSFLNIPGSPADISPNRPLKVRLGIQNNMVHPIMYNYLVKAYPKVKTVVMTEMNIGLDPVIAHRKSVAEQHGIKVLAVELYPLESFDLYPVQTRVLSFKPDAIDLGSCPPDHASLHVKAARELGFKGPIFYHSPVDPAIIFRAVGAEKSNDVYGAGVDITSQKNITPMMREVEKGWKKKYTEPFVSDSLLAFDVTWVLSQGISKAGSLDAEIVAKTFETLTKPGSLQTVFGSAHMGGLKTFGVNKALVRPIPLSLIKNGKIELVSLTLPNLP
jgi:branched-chain amino acid transport system substrate-binding protein